MPAILVSNVSAGDEIKFNQLHNGVDAQRGFECYVNTEGFKLGKFIDIEATRFTVKKAGATYVKEICRMLLKYGNVLSCVICRGEVLIGTNYVRACELLGMTPRCYIIEDSLFDQAFDYWVIIALAFGVSCIFIDIGATIGVDLGFLQLMGWFVLAIYIINELTSIVENMMALGVDVPDILVKGLAAARTVVDQAGDKVVPDEKTE